MANEHAPPNYEFPRPSLDDEFAERFELSGALRFETNPQMRTCQEERPAIRLSRTEACVFARRSYART